MRTVKVSFQELEELGYHFSESDSMDKEGAYVLFEDGSVDTEAGDTVVTSRDAKEWKGDEEFKKAFEKLGK